MAMLASKNQMQGMGSGNGSAQLQATRDYNMLSGSRRTPLSDAANHGTFASPTESEFSEAYEGSDPVRSWDEKQVGDWLRSIGCGVYATMFKENNVNGSNLIECDQAVLKEMGIKKIGDRVRIFVGIKALRNKSIPNQKKRNRDSIANLDRLNTPSSAISPFTTTQFPGRDRSVGAGTKRYSAQFGQSGYSSGYSQPSPRDGGRAGQAGYFSNPPSAKTATGHLPETPSTASSSGKMLSRSESIAKLPANKDVIRVIYGGQTKMLDIRGWKSAEDIMAQTLRKMNRPETHVRNYCFYVTDPIPEDSDRCRRLSEKELMDVCSSQNNSLRGRLILRTIHSGEPSTEEIDRSHALAIEEVKAEHQTAFDSNSTRGLAKAERLLGEPLADMRDPLSPAIRNHTPMIATERRPTLPRTRMAAPPPTHPPSQTELPKRVSSRPPPKPISNFPGERPASEFISYDLSSYFPDHEPKAIQRTVTLAQRRSARLSKAISRLSTASQVSVKDIMKDAPALPAIPNSFLSHDPFSSSAVEKPARPLSVWRQSIVSSALHPLAEESPTEIEPDRKSYVSFGDSASELSVGRPSISTPINVTDPDGGSSTVTSFFEDNGSTGTGGHSTLNDQYREALAADGEEIDEQLDSFLTGNTFDKASWMQGALIGQGSFGSVYLALHAVTGELMAVKQVELPGKSGADPALDRRKESMLAALKREINLLSDLSHENIVQYLGVQGTDEHLNIFLEYVPGGSVASMLNNYGHLNEPLIRSFVRQILSGLSYLHKRDIIHRDIKGANILVDNKGKVKISDFGISKKVELSSASGAANAAASGNGGTDTKGNKRVSMQGSVFWMAPEVVRQTSYTRKADIWSLGCLIVEMFTGEHPFPKMNQMQAIFQIGGSKKPDIPENAGQDARDFLERTFEIDENKRPEAEELTELAFLAEKL